MEQKRFLQADIAGAISDLQASMKEFLLKKKLYRLLLRGKGLEFESYRAYAPDDDASTIDWKASKRTNSLLVKQYRDERNLQVIFLIDLGENMVFGSVNKLKCEYTAEVAAAFSYLIMKTGDKPGYVFFSDKVHDYIKPSRGKRHFNRFIDYITDVKNYRGFSCLDKALGFLIDYVSKNVESVIIISDFLSFSEKTRKNLSLVAHKFETTALMIRDPLDNSLPDMAGEIVIEDPASGQQLLVNPKIAKEAYERYSKNQRENVRNTCLDYNIDLLEITIDKPFVPTLSSFLKKRVKHRGGA